MVSIPPSHDGWTGSPPASIAASICSRQMEANSPAVEADTRGTDFLPSAAAAIGHRSVPLPSAHPGSREWIDMSRQSRVVRALAGGITLVCGMLPAQSRKIGDLAAGKLLVTERQAPDPLFAESVILLIHYSADGVVGLMLNQPAGVPLSRLRELDGARNRSDPAYVGGPVEIAQVSALVRAPSAPPNAIHVTADLYAVQTKRGLETALKASKGSTDLRVYLGYCGWIIPQLQNEVTRGSWYIFDHGDRFAFDSAPRTLWKRLIDRTEGELVWTPLPARQPVKPVSWNR